MFLSRNSDAGELPNASSSSQRVLCNQLETVSSVAAMG